MQFINATFCAQGRVSTRLLCCVVLSTVVGVVTAKVVPTMLAVSTVDVAVVVAVLVVVEQLWW